jgi:hypothetical protein
VKASVPPLELEADEEQDEVLEPELDEPDEQMNEETEDESLQTAPKRKRKKRKSVTMPPRKRKDPLVATTANFAPGSRRIPTSTTTSTNTDDQARMGSGGKGKQRKVESEEEEDQENASDSSVNEYEPTPRVRSKKRRRSASKEDRGSANDEGSEDDPANYPPRPRPNTIPVTTQRLAHVRALQHVHFADSEERELEPFPKKLGVNAVDVLAQICSELVAKTVKDLDAKADKEHGSRKKEEWEFKGRIVSMFGEELAGGLFKLTEALDHNQALATRVKQAERDRKRIREELVDVKRERDAVALRMDAVREDHERATREAEEEGVLEGLVRGIEMAVQRARALGVEENAEMVGLDARVYEVMGNLSSVEGGKGILDRVKEFNGGLERVVGVL